MTGDYTSSHSVAEDVFLEVPRSKMFMQELPQPKIVKLEYSVDSTIPSSGSHPNITIWKKEIIPVDPEPSHQSKQELMEETHASC